jgi:hypothetical protein
MIGKVQGEGAQVKDTHINPGKWGNLPVGKRFELGF